MHYLNFWLELGTGTEDRTGFFTGNFGSYRFFVPVYRAVSYSTSCWLFPWSAGEHWSMCFGILRSFEVSIEQWCLRMCACMFDVPPPAILTWALHVVHTATFSSIWLSDFRFFNPQKRPYGCFAPLVLLHCEIVRHDFFFFFGQLGSYVPCGTYRYSWPYRYSVPPHRAAVLPVLPVSTASSISDVTMLCGQNIATTKRVQPGNVVRAALTLCVCTTKFLEYWRWFDCK